MRILVVSPALRCYRQYTWRFMEIGLMFGVGFALGFIFGMNLSRVVWPEYEENIWERKSREKRMKDEAVEEYKKEIRNES